MLQVGGQIPGCKCFNLHTLYSSCSHRYGVSGQAQRVTIHIVERRRVTVKRAEGEGGQDDTQWSAGFDSPDEDMVY